MGALSITGLPGIKSDFEPLVPGAIKVPNTNFYRRRPSTATTPRRSAAGPPTRSAGPSSARARTRSPRSSWSRCRTPAAASRRRPATSSGSGRSATAYDVLLVSDEVICAFGRLGEYFGAKRYGYQPDIITCAKGMTSGYAPLGAMIASDRLVEPFLTETGIVRPRRHLRRAPGLLRGGPGQPGHLRPRGPDRARPRQRGRRSGPPWRSCSTCRSSATSAATATSTASSWSRTRRPGRPSTTAESERLLRGFLSTALFEAGPLLPGRRPRRPGRPAGPAADLRRSSTSTRSSRSCARS